MYIRSLLCEILIFCVIIMVFILVRIGEGMRNNSSKNWACASVITFMATTALSYFYFARIYGFDSLSYDTYYYFNVFYKMLMLFSVLCFMKFAEEMSVMLSKLGSYVIYTGLVFSVIMVKVELMYKNTGLFLNDNIDGNVFEDFDNLWYVFILLELLVITTELIVNYRNKQNYVHRDSIRPLISFPVVLIVSYLLQLFVFNIPIWIMGGVISMLYMYICFVGNAISNDEMTGLDNKRELLNDMDERINNNRKWFLIIFDANRFKTINDTFGHMEGDLAIKEIGNCLKSATVRTDAKAYRFGGDEFMVIYDTSNEKEIHALLEEVEKNVKEKNDILKKPYKLSLSYGYAFCSEENCATIPEIIESADKAMYVMKERIHKNG